MKKAFTLLELVFVVLILGILTGLSLSFTNTRKDEVKLLKLKLDYEMLNSALALMRSETKLKHLNFPEVLDNAKVNSAKEKLFYCKEDSCTYSLLDIPIYSDFNAWIKVAKNQYRFFLSPKKSLDFIYNPKEGVLECLQSQKCKDLL